jgi:predicted RNA-binding protein YlxR (DUF448 family)
MRIAVSGELAGAGDGAPRRALAVHDRDGTMPGRGAYLCRDAGPERPAEACLALALRRGAIARALRAAVRVEDKLVESVSR